MKLNRSCAIGNCQSKKIFLARVEARSRTRKIFLMTFDPISREISSRQAFLARLENFSLARGNTNKNRKTCKIILNQDGQKEKRRERSGPASSSTPIQTNHLLHCGVCCFVLFCFIWSNNDVCYFRFFLSTDRSKRKELLSRWYLLFSFLALSRSIL